MSKNATTKSPQQPEQSIQDELDGAACYALFCGHCYYPKGGAEDFRSFGGTVEELKAIYEENADRWSMEVSGKYADPWGHIANVSTMTLVAAVHGHGEWSDFPTV